MLEKQLEEGNQRELLVALSPMCPIVEDVPCRHSVRR